MKEEYIGMKSVLSKTFKLIQVLARDNKEVQETIFYNMDILLEVTLVPSDLALALKEVRNYRDHFSVSNNIDTIF